MKKLNRNQLRKLIQESAYGYENLGYGNSREDNNFINFIERLNNLNLKESDPLVLSNIIYSLGLQARQGSYLLDYVKRLPKLANEYPNYRQIAQFAKDAFLSFLHDISDPYGAFTEEAQRMEGTPYAIELVGKILEHLRLIDY